MTTDTATPGDAGTSVAWDGADLVITRAFHAPRELVFRAWTEAEHFARWFVPNDFSMPFCTLDPRPGGELHFCHRWPGHEDAWVGGVYDEVVPPERISFACWFSNPAGERIERPGRPSEMHITVTLAEEGGRTLLTARHRGLAEDQGEVQGWTESLDRLAEHLADA